MNGSPAVDEVGTIYGTATFAGMGSSAFAIGSDGVEKWRTPLGNVGTLDQGGVVIGLDGSIIVTVKRAPGSNRRNHLFVSGRSYPMALRHCGRCKRLCGN